MAGTLSVVLGLGEFEYCAPKEKLKVLVAGESDPEFLQKLSKTFMEGGDDKGVKYVNPVNWVSPKTEQQKVTCG